MTCSYCGCRNRHGEHRCQRCGRKPDDTLTGEFILHRTDGALAAELQPAEQSHSTQQTAGPPRPKAGFARAVQASLFQQSRSSKVIPIASFTPVPVVDLGGAPKPPRAASKPPVRRAPRPVVEEQASLDFLPPSPAKPRTLGTTVEAVIYCEDPVATRLHRTVAAGLDWSMVLVAYVMFLLTFHFWGCELVFTRTNLMVFGGVLALFGAFYGILWAVAGMETPGMRWTNLRLTTFDGFRPERKQRVLRFLGSCMSLCTVVGLLWSFADEESLAWQDHISRTFPTPRRMEFQIFHRK